jgi:hypothetical protein
MATGLLPSLTLGCGTFGGTSTTDNVTYTHLLNVKRVAYSIPSRRISFLRKLKDMLDRVAGEGSNAFLS